VFAHSYESYYYDYHWGEKTKSFYCDPLAFNLDSSVDYLAINTADVLSLQSTSVSPLGIHEHIVTAYLQNFPSNSIPVKFSVEIIGCSISAFFADSSFDPGTPHYRVDLLFTGTYVLGQDGLKSFPFTFEDFEMQTGDSSCMSVYTMLYSLFVDDVLVTPSNAANFPWLIFSEDVAQFAILSGDNSDSKNYYTIRVEGRLQTFPAETVARTVVQF